MRQSKFSPEVQERAVRMVLEHQHEHGSQWAAIGSISGKFGCTPETLRRWVRQAEKDRGVRPGPTTSDLERLKQLEREKWVVPLTQEEEKEGDRIERALVRVRQDYDAQYITQWVNFFRDVEVEIPPNNKEAISEFKVLSTPDWPYQRLLRTLADQAQKVIEDDGRLTLVEIKAGQTFHADATRSLDTVARHIGTPLQRALVYGGDLDMQRGETGGHGVKLSAPAAGSAPGVKPTPPTPPSVPTTTSLVEKKGKGALFRIDEAGRVEQLHAVVDGFYNALHLDAAGNLYAAASAPGGRGRVYEVKPDRTVLTLLELKESDVLALSLPLSGGERFVGTGNSAALYKLGEGPPKDPSYQSRVIDAQAAAHWGTLRYLGQGELRVETRTGNLSKPDATWSPWQPLRAPARSPAPITFEQLGKIASPPGRYLQARFLLADRAVLSDFTVHYQPVNQRARVTDILIGEDPSGRVARGIKPTSLLRPRSPVIKLRWKLENPDEDDLSYRVYIRPATPDGARAAGPAAASGRPLTGGSAAAVAGETDAGWLRLSGPEPLTRAELDWNTDTVGDGLYELKVVVSDERSNPPELVQTSELVSSPFLIDNRRPELREVRWNPATQTLSGQAVDAVSPILELSYSIDGGDFFPIAPRDGVLDDTSEDFQVRPPRLPSGSHLALVRAGDAADNVSTVQLVIQVK